MEKSVMTVDELAVAMDISRPKAYELIHSQSGPPVVRVGRCIRIPVDGFKEWLSNQGKIGEARYAG